MRKTTLPLLALIALMFTVEGFGQDPEFPFPNGPLDSPISLFPFYDEAAPVIPLDGAHANPPTETWIKGIASLQLQGNRLNYHVRTTGPFQGLELWHSGSLSLRITGNSTEFELPLILGGFTAPSYDLIVHEPGEVVPVEDVYLMFLNGSVTLTDLQLADLLSGQSLLTVDFGASGAIAGQISAIPEPSLTALLVSGAAAMTCCLRRRR